jgi:hypothetical protein
VLVRKLAMQNCPNSGKPPQSGNPEPSPAQYLREGVETRRVAPKPRFMREMVKG